ncbi:hypothetical protein LIA77_06443 [Sarocladium implicatum]|nr:hypothetical protein LIA77_06443 [Sarocladium implicatum]
MGKEVFWRYSKFAAGEEAAANPQKKERGNWRSSKRGTGQQGTEQATRRPSRSQPIGPTSVERRRVGCQGPCAFSGRQRIAGASLVAGNTETRRRGPPPPPTGNRETPPAVQSGPTILEMPSLCNRPCLVMSALSTNSPLEANRRFLHICHDQHARMATPSTSLASRIPWDAGELHCLTPPSARIWPIRKVKHTPLQRRSAHFRSLNCASSSLVQGSASGRACRRTSTAHTQSTYSVVMTTVELATRQEVGTDQDLAGHRRNPVQRSTTLETKCDNSRPPGGGWSRSRLLRSALFDADVSRHPEETPSPPLTTVPANQRPCLRQGAHLPVSFAIVLSPGTSKFCLCSDQPVTFLLFSAKLTAL